MHRLWLNIHILSSTHAALIGRPRRRGRSRLRPREAAADRTLQQQAHQSTQYRRRMSNRQNDALDSHSSCPKEMPNVSQLPGTARMDRQTSQSGHHGNGTKASWHTQRHGCRTRKLPSCRSRLNTVAAKTGAAQELFGPSLRYDIYHTSRCGVAKVSTEPID